MYYFSYLFIYYFL
uniref:Uncharacterized protein n=1 Tax=Anguilla anguilla TaxID=7936 RepID=A0A0E9S3U3_ANGAN